MNDLLFCLLAAITVMVTVAHVADDIRSGYEITPWYFIAYAVALCEMVYIMAYAAPKATGTTIYIGSLIIMTASFTSIVTGRFFALLSLRSQADIMDPIDYQHRHSRCILNVVTGSILGIITMVLVLDSVTISFK